MKKEFKVSISAALLLLISFLEPAALIGPTQPPVDTTTLYVGRGAWGPAHTDPVRAYDRLSGELIFNVYDTLIVFGKPVTDQWKTWDVHEQYWEFSPSLATNVPTRQEVIMVVPDTGINPTDPVCYWFEPFPPDGKWYHIEGWVDNNPDGVLGYCDVLYIGEYYAPMEPIQAAITVRTWHVLEYLPGVSVTVHHYYYDFDVRTDPAIYFYDYTGAAVGTYDIDDVEYSFERGLVFDMFHGPYWMFYKPLFDQMNSDWWGEDTTGDPAKAWCLSYLIEDVFEQPSPNVFRINVGIAFPDVAFKQILCQTCASILDKDWCISMGLWNGELFTDTDIDGFPDWFESYAEGGWRHVDYTQDPIDLVDPFNYAGSGPYRVAVTDESSMVVIFQRNANYWRGWPAPDRKSYLEYIDLEYIPNWTARREAFKACQLDICDVPRTFMTQLLDPYGDPTDPKIKTIKNISPALSLDAMFFTFTVDPLSPAIYTGQFPDGIPANFFNNSYVRTAFSYAFNHSKYLSEAWLNEAICRETPDIFGLLPDYYCHNPDPPWIYDKDLTKVVQQLQLAFFTQNGETRSVWDWGGFHLKMYYEAGDEQARLACEYIRDTFAEINNLYLRNFLITIQEVTSPTFLDYMETFYMPLFVTDWQADFADADDFKRPFMHSQGYFAFFQNYTAGNGWAATPGPRTGLTKDLLIDLAIKTPDGLEREELYKDLDDIYLADCPSLPIAQSSGRRWQKSWVRGWYYNALYPSDYYYHIYKEDAPWADVTGPMIGVPDGLVNMLDVYYVAEHYGANAPYPARFPPYDPKWAPGTYGCGGCDVRGDRYVDFRDVSYTAAYWGEGTCPPEQEHGGTVDLIVETSREIVAIDYTVNVTVRVSNVDSLTGYKICLSYNASLLKLVNFTVAPVLGWDMTTNDNLTKTCDGKTCIIVDCLKLPWSGSPFDGDTILVNFTLKGIAKGNSTLSVSRSTLASGDQRILYSTIDTSVRIIYTGDVNEDGICNMRDIGACCNAFMATLDADGNYTHKPPCFLCPHSPNTDIDGDGVVNMRDIGIACNNFNKP